MSGVGSLVLEKKEKPATKAKAKAKPKKKQEEEEEASDEEEEKKSTKAKAKKKTTKAGKKEGSPAKVGRGESSGQHARSVGGCSAGACVDIFSRGSLHLVLALLPVQVDHSHPLSSLENRHEEYMELTVDALRNMLNLNMISLPKDKKKDAIAWQCVYGEASPTDTGDGTTSSVARGSAVSSGSHFVPFVRCVPFFLLCSRL